MSNQRILNMLWSSTNDHSIKAQVKGVTSHTDGDNTVIADTEIIKKMFRITAEHAEDMALQSSAHEGAHLQYTDFDGHKPVLDSVPNAHRNTLFDLINIIEDRRVDALTSIKYPGYAVMSEKCNKALNSSYATRQLSGDEKQDKLRAISYVSSMGEQALNMWQDYAEQKVPKTAIDRVMNSTPQSTFESAEIAQEILYDVFPELLTPKPQSKSKDKSKQETPPHETEKEDNENTENNTGENDNTDEQDESEGSENQENDKDDEGDNDDDDTEGDNESGDENGNDDDNANSDGDNGGDNDSDDSDDDNAADDSDNNDDSNREGDSDEDDSDTEVEYTEQSFAGNDPRVKKDLMKDLQQAIEEKQAEEQNDKKLRINRHKQALEEMAEHAHITTGNRNNKGTQSMPLEKVLEIEDLCQKGGIMSEGCAFIPVDFTKTKAFPMTSQELIGGKTIAREIRNALEVSKGTDVTSKSGIINARKVHRTLYQNNPSVFTKQTTDEFGDFVVTVLVDASGSQSSRVQGIRRATSMVAYALQQNNIKVRVVTFQWNSTPQGGAVIHNVFVDFDNTNNASQCKNISSGGSNRDSFSIYAETEILKQRPEEHKMLMILSDGLPMCDGGHFQGNGYTRSLDLLNEKGTHVRGVDMAHKAVQHARKSLDSVFGVYYGSNEQGTIEQEKLIYGNDFAMVRNIDGFVSVIIRKLIKEIERCSEK